ncbi:MAG: hypothetical protein AAFR15_02025 [Cyanobacteria bacterium J06627_15]
MGNPKSDSELNHYLRQRLPTHLRHSFTEAQLTAIRSMYSNLGRSNSALIDQRLTIPFIGGRLYAVFMIGRDCRTQPRTTLKRALKARLIMAALIAVGCSSILGLVKLRQIYSTSAYRRSFATEKSAHPTAVPFKRNQEECETSGREWRDDECIDHEHDPTF